MRRLAARIDRVGTLAVDMLDALRDRSIPRGAAVSIELSMARVTDRLIHASDAAAVLDIVDMGRMLGTLLEFLPPRAADALRAWDRELALLWREAVSELGSPW